METPSHSYVMRSRKSPLLWTRNIENNLEKTNEIKNYMEKNMNNHYWFSFQNNWTKEYLLSEPEKVIV